MNDDEIEKLRQMIESTTKPAFIAWRTEMPTSHDGPGYTGGNYRPVFREILEIHEHNDEPVAMLGDGLGGNVALWACEFSEFFKIEPLTINHETIS